MTFNFDLFFSGLHRLDKKYHLTSECTSQSKLRNMITTYIIEGEENNIDIIYLSDDILECIVPSLNNFVKISGIDYPYDLDLKFIDLLAKSGYPNDE